MVMPWASIINGVSSGVTSYFTGRANATIAQMQADNYRSQARLAILQANQQNAYLNEELGGQVWRTAEQARIFMGAQNAAIGASGFADVSVGDKRLFADTIRKRDQEINTLNRNAYLQAFETNRAAAMEASRLEYQARAAEITKHYNSGGWLAATSLLSAGSSFMSSAMANEWSNRDTTPTTKSVTKKLNAFDDKSIQNLDKKISSLNTSTNPNLLTPAAGKLKYSPTSELAKGFTFNSLTPSSSKINYLGGTFGGVKLIKGF